MKSIETCSCNASGQVWKDWERIIMVTVHKTKWSFKKKWILIFSFIFYSPSHLTEKTKASLWDQLTNTSGTIIGVTSCIVILLIIISVIVQIKQPRKRFVQKKADFDQTVFQEVFEPPHYELCTLRGTGTSVDLADLADDFENYHKLRRSSSKCIHDHHCGSQLSSTKGSHSNLSTRDTPILTEIQPQPAKPLIQPMNRRNILVMKHSYSQDAADVCEIDEIEEVPTTSHRLSRHDKAVQRSVSIDFWWKTFAWRLASALFSIYLFFLICIPVYSPIIVHELSFFFFQDAFMHSGGRSLMGRGWWRRRSFWYHCMKIPKSVILLAKNPKLSSFIFLGIY